MVGIWKELPHIQERQSTWGSLAKSQPGVKIAKKREKAEERVIERRYVLKREVCGLQ